MFTPQLPTLPSHPPQKDGPNYARTICDPSLSDEERIEEWLIIYHSYWGKFPVKEMNDTADKAYADVLEWLKGAPGAPGASDIADDRLSKIDIKEFGILMNVCTADDSLDYAKIAVQKFVDKGLEKTTKDIIEAMVTKALAQKAAGTKVGGKLVGEILEYSLKKAGGRAALLKFNDLLTGPVGLYSAIGEFTAYTLCVSVGVTNPKHIVRSGAFAGILSGAAAGAALGGPVGALTGAGIGTIGVVGGGVVDAMFNAFKGGAKDNWCFVQVGELRRGNTPICAGTYKSSDGWYAKTYQNRYHRTDEKHYFSAGNDQDESFQVCFWDEWGYEIKTYTHVWYRDTFFVSKSTVDGSLRVVFCRGGMNKEGPGTVELFVRK